MLYHRDVKWHDDFNKKALELITDDMTISRHCVNHATSTSTDLYARKHTYTIDEIKRAVAFIKAHNIPCFEVETVGDDDNREVVKGVWRIHNKKRNVDIVIVCRRGIVITGWVAQPDDLHTTLDVSRYAKR